MVGLKDLASLVQDALWPTRVPVLQYGAGLFGSITSPGAEADTAKLQTAAFEGWASLTGQPLRSFAETSSAIRPLHPGGGYRAGTSEGL